MNILRKIQKKLFPKAWWRWLHDVEWVEIGGETFKCIRKSDISSIYYENKYLNVIAGDHYHSFRDENYVIYKKLRASLLMGPIRPEEIDLIKKRQENNENT